MEPYGTTERYAKLLYISILASARLSPVLHGSMLPLTPVQPTLRWRARYTRCCSIGRGACVLWLGDTAVSVSSPSGPDVPGTSSARRAGGGR